MPKTIEQIMSKNIECVSPTVTLKEVARKMKNVDSGVLPVFDGKELLGVITDRDIVMRTLAEDKDPTVTKVSEAMSQNTITCKPSDDIDVATKLMKQHQIRRVVVVDEQKKPVGIVSLGDLALNENIEDKTVEVLERVSKSNSAA